MSKKGGSKKDLFQTILDLRNKITFLEKKIQSLHDQRTNLYNACTIAVQQPHNKNCWTLQKSNPGRCTCYISDLEKAFEDAREKTE